MRIAIAAAAVGLAALLVASGAPAPAAAACTDFVHVAGQGPSCRVSGGWLVRLPGGRTVFTHGADAAPPRAPMPGSARTAAAPGQCVDQWHHHIEIVAATFAGAPDRTGTLRSDLHRQFFDADSTYLDDQAFQDFGVHEHLYVWCDASAAPIVTHLALSTDSSNTTFSTIVGDAVAAGLDSHLAHYWIYLDGHAGGLGGQSTVTPDDTPGLLNENNIGPAYSINYGWTSAQGGGFIFAHENAHAMGAVQFSAPHTTGAFHCTDGLDVMCYNDGGTFGGDYTSSACSAIPYTFDCGHDDYFNPKPAVGSYLSTHRNTGVWTNLWLQAPIP